MGGHMGLPLQGFAPWENALVCPYRGLLYERGRLSSLDGLLYG